MTNIQKLVGELYKKNEFIDFLCVGAQKAGTTSLHHMLGNDKRIFLPEEKEVHYFTQHYSKGIEWYKNKFREATVNQIKGEITPFYLFHEEAPKRIADKFENIKILILLRDPAERTISHYEHAIRNGNEKLGLLGALMAENSRLSGYKEKIKKWDGYHKAYQQNSYLKRSRYEEQVNRYIKHFGKKNLCIIKSEDLFEGKQNSIRQIYDFLGLEMQPSGMQMGWHNKGEKPQSYEQEKRDLRIILSETYRYCEEEWGITWKQAYHSHEGVKGRLKSLDD